MKFPYRHYRTGPSPTVPSGVLHRPEVPLRIIGATGALSMWTLVDAGSDETLLPLSVGQMIGATMNAAQTWQVEGIGGQAVSVILGEVVLELTDGSQTYRWPAKIGLVDFANPQDEIALVGHAGCLDYFRMTFDGHLRSLEIEASPAFPGQVL